MWAAVHFFATGALPLPAPVALKEDADFRLQSPAFLTHGKNLVNHKNLECKSKNAGDKTSPTQAHSSAPFLYSHTYPISRMPRNTNIETSANSPICAITQPRYRIAQGIRNIVSTSNTTKSMAMM